MEREFLQGVEHALYIDFGTYQRWGKLLGGLLLAKERDKGTWRRRYAATGAGVAARAGVLPFGVQLPSQGQVYRYPYPSPPQEHIGAGTAAASGANAEGAYSSSTRADGLPVHRRPAAPSAQQQQQQPQAQAQSQGYVLPPPTQQTLPPLSSSSISAYQPQQQQPQQIYGPALVPVVRGRQRAPSNASISRQRTRAQSSSPILPSGRLHPTALPLNANINGQPHAQQYSNGASGYQYDGQYSFTFAPPINAPQVSLRLPIPTPASSAQASQPQPTQHHQTSYPSSTSAGMKRGAAESSPVVKKSAPVDMGSSRTSPTANKVAKLEHGAGLRQQQQRGVSQRDVQQRLAQLSIHNLGQQRAGPSSSGGQRISPDSAVGEEHPRFVDPVINANLPSGSRVVPPAEPTLQRTLQASYAPDAQRAVPQVCTFKSSMLSPTTRANVQNCYPVPVVQCTRIIWQP
ncbi:hypothetical protein DL93DRAFT_1564253 [Clavulina sp. PMI_390]|nr:hypothetical protein DL93DRAFT_1564253 [Clavulina sp. PMI_390]